jgi:NAD(P)-dependent dehydrogenase (short-subunit alcohol dehydrogenase family)
MRLLNKVIVVTGGLGYLGRQFIPSILKEGGIPVVVDVKVEMNSSYDSFKDAGVDLFDVDITNLQQIQNLVSFLNSKYGKIDALINNAYPRNKNYGKSFFDVTYEDFYENLGMHLGGYFNMSQQFAKYFKKQGYGNIINMSSIYGIIAPKFEIYDNTTMTMPVEYAAIKGGLNHLSKYMAKYFKGMNIRVNTISPGGLIDQQPKDFIDAYNASCLNKGMLDREDIVGTLIYLLSDDSLFVNGQNIVIDDGFTL